jgi:solute carrier family 38 (sodium-coupled neutral amino acid transporter), member 9
MRYYNKLSTPSINNNNNNNNHHQSPYDSTLNNSSLVVPAHIVPPELLLPVIHLSQRYSKAISSTSSNTTETTQLSSSNDTESLDANEQPRTSSMTLIFSIWNTMMGSSLLALPWGFSQSGFATGLLMVFLLGVMSCYTCLLILWHGHGTDDLFFVCFRYLGRVGKYVCWAAGVLLLVGSTLAYDILMSGILDSLVSAILSFSSPNGQPEQVWWWNSKIAALLVLLFVFPIANLKSFGLLVKFNTLGVISVFYTVGFLIIYCCFFQRLTFEHVPQFHSGFVVFSGMLSVSYFMHSLILPMMKHAEHPEHNVRNVLIGYSLVGICYTAIGSVGYLAYWQVYTSATFPQEFLSVFDNTNVGALIARLALLFQLATVYPLLLLIIRIQFFGLLWNSAYPGWLHVLILNIVITGAATLFACFYPNFGSILRYAQANSFHVLSLSLSLSLSPSPRGHGVE